MKSRIDSMRWRRRSAKKTLFIHRYSCKNIIVWSICACTFSKCMCSELIGSFNSLGSKAENLSLRGFLFNISSTFLFCGIWILVCYSNDCVTFDGLLSSYLSDIRLIIGSFFAILFTWLLLTVGVSSVYSPILLGRRSLKQLVSSRISSCSFTSSVEQGWWSNLAVSFRKWRKKVNC